MATYEKKWQDYYLENYGETYDEEEGYVRPEGMDDETYAIGQNLYNNYVLGTDLTSQYNTNVSQVETQQFADQKQADATYQKLLKYLPEINKASGIGNLGVAQTTYTNAANSYQGNVNTINTEANTNKTTMLQDYETAIAENEAATVDNETTINSKWTEQYIANADAVKTEVDDIIKLYTDENDIDTGVEKASAYIDANKSQLGNQYDFVKSYLEAIDTSEVEYTTEDAIADKMTYADATAKGVDLAGYTEETWSNAIGTNTFATKSQAEVDATKAVKSSTGSDTGYTVAVKKLVNSKYATEAKDWLSGQNAGVTITDSSGNSKTYEVEAKGGAKGYYKGKPDTATQKIIDNMEIGSAAVIDGEIYVRIADYTAGVGMVKYVQLETAEKAKDNYGLLKAQLTKMGAVYTTK